MDRDARADAFARTFASLPALALLVDRRGTIIAVNGRAEVAFGLPAAELEGRSWIERVHPEDRSTLLAALAASPPTSDRDEIQSIDARILRADGSFVWISWGFGADAGLVLAMGRVVDGERRRAEVSTRRLALAEGSGLAWVARDAAGRVTHWSRGAELLYGWTEAEVIGQVLGALLGRRALGRGRLEDVEAELEHRGRWSGELHATTRDGREYVIETVMTRVPDPERGPVFVEAHVDVTARVEAAARQSALVSTVSHELRTPLTGIRGALGLLDAGVAGELPVEARELVAIASTSSERLTRLVDGLLELGKLEAGKLELVKHTLDATVIAERARTLMHGLSEARRVPIELRAPEALTVFADEERILQILTNLLSNAVKYSPEGVAVVVSVGRGVDPERVRFSVRDRGPGIAPEDLGRIFQRFQQLDRASGRPKEGTGLGLAIAKALVEEHGGEIGVDSVLGQGADVWFEVPRAEGAPAAVERPGHRTRVLVWASGEGAEAVARGIDAAVFELVVVRARASAEGVLATWAPRVVVVVLDDGLLCDEVAAVARLCGGVPWIAIGRDDASGPVDDVPFVDVLPRPIDGRRLARALRRAAFGEHAPRVLIVDDDVGTRVVVAALLAPLAIECLFAVDGLDAIQRAREHRPDLILLDVDLPRASGFDVVSVLRQEVLASTPLLVHSGRVLSAEEREALTLGVTRWCVKGRTPERELVALVRELLLDVGEPFDAGDTKTFAVPPLGPRNSR